MAIRRWTITLAFDDHSCTIMANRGADEILWYQPIDLGEMTEPARYEAVRYDLWMAVLAVLHHIAQVEQLW